MDTNDGPRRLRWGWRAELTMAALIAVGQLVGTWLAQRHQSGFTRLDVLGYLLLAAAPAAIPLRRRWPIPALATVFAITLSYALLDYPGGPVWAPLIITFGTVLVAGHRLAGYLFLVAGYATFTWLPDAAVNPFENITVDSWDAGYRFFPGQVLASLIQGGTAELGLTRAVLTAVVYAGIAAAATLVLVSRRDVTA